MGRLPKKEAAHKAKISKEEKPKHLQTLMMIVCKNVIITMTFYNG